MSAIGSMEHHSARDDQTQGWHLFHVTSIPSNSHEWRVFMVCLNVNMDHIKWNPSIVTTSSSWTLTSHYKLHTWDPSISMWPVVRGHRMSHVGQDHSRPIWTFHHSFSIKSASQRCLHARLIPQNSSHVTWKVIFSWNIYFKFNDHACGEEMLSVMMIWYKLIINSCLINNITQTPPSKDPPSTQNTQYFSLNFSFGCYQRQDVKKYWRCWNVLQI